MPVILRQSASERKAPAFPQFAPWTELDTMTIAKSIAFSLSFGLEDIEYTTAVGTYQAVLDPLLGAGAGAALFSEDLWRAQPFDPASSVPDASVPPRPRRPDSPPKRPNQRSCRRWPPIRAS
jgi:penicillin amidase